MHHAVLSVEHRDDQAAVEVLVPAVAQDADGLQLTPHLRAGLAVLLGQAVRERAIGEAQPKPLHHLLRPEPALFEVAEGLGALLERLVVVVEDAGHQHVLVRRVLDGGELGGRGLLRHRRALPALLGLGERLERDEVGPEQLDGVTTAEPLGLHDPVDDAAAFLARAIAAPAVGLRRDAQGRRLGRTERAQTDDLISAALELHALGLGQPLEADLGVQALELVGRDAGHVALLRVCAAGSRTRP